MTQGFEINYTDKSTGDNFPLAWVVPTIRVSKSGNENPNNTVGQITFKYKIWSSKQLYLDGKDPILFDLGFDNYTNNAIFSQYFTPELLAAIKLAEFNYLAAVINDPPK
jgi:hypothetical protein